MKRPTMPPPAVWMIAIAFLTTGCEPDNRLLELCKESLRRQGDPKHLSRFLQCYAAEKAKLEARKRGHSIAEQQLADGSIKLTVQVQGGAA